MPSISDPTPTSCRLMLQTLAIAFDNLNVTDIHVEHCSKAASLVYKMMADADKTWAETGKLPRYISTDMVRLMRGEDYSAAQVIRMIINWDMSESGYEYWAYMADYLE